MEEVVRALHESFPGIDTSALEVDKYSHRVTGHIVWSDFEGVTQIERQTRLRDMLSSNLSKDALMDIGAILTFTPIEIEAAMEPAY